MSQARQLIENDGDELKHELLSTDDLKRFVLDGRVHLDGNVHRSSHHYVHERSTNVEISHVSLDFDSDEQNAFWQETVDTAVEVLLEDIESEMIDYNNAIYRDLEAAYDYDNSDEQVDNNIAANEYEFDEDGTTGEGFQFDQLSDDAKEKARDWYREASAGDNYFSEPVIEDWKARLEKKGFNDPEISWSGFSSQGDGASFTCKSIDFKKYYSAFNPLSPDGGGAEGEAGAVADGGV